MSVSPSDGLEITDHVPYRVLVQIEQLVATANTTPIRFIRTNGLPITPVHTQAPFPTACVARHKAAGYDDCTECQAHALEASSIGEPSPFTYLCPGGATCHVHAIMWQGCAIGGMLGGPTPQPSQRLLELMAQANALLTVFLEMQHGSVTQSEKGRDAALRQEANLQMLRAQLNPHFLFNTLNIISAYALIEDAPKTQGVVHDLAKVLRYAMRWESDLALLDDEIEQVKRYVSIQSERFPDRFTFHLSIEPALLKILVPRMALQLLVENAVLHGIEPLERQGTVHLLGYRRGPTVVLEVCDDGVGIPPDELAGLEQSNDAKTGIGLTNLRRRLLYHYGAKAAMDIHSRPSLGTSVRLILPDVE